MPLATPSGHIDAMPQTALLANHPVSTTPPLAVVPPPPSAPEVMEPVDNDGRCISGWMRSRCIGEGTFAVVYQARPATCPEDSPADYAIKILRPAFHSDPAAIRTMQREAYVGRSVTHPHLLSVLSASLDTAPYFVVSPYLSGATLADVLRFRGRLRVPLALWVTRQVAEALACLHESGWVHRDIKPANIMMSENGHCTLIDLGFALHADDAAAGLSAALEGSLQYTAPEIFLSRGSVTPRSDIYSLGIVLYELLSGYRPFGSTDPALIIESHLREVAPKIRQRCPHVPVEAAHLVHQMLAKDPLRRPPTCRDLVEQLVQLEIETFTDRGW